MKRKTVNKINETLERNNSTYLFGVDARRKQTKSLRDLKEKKTWRCKLEMLLSFFVFFFNVNVKHKKKQNENLKRTFKKIKYQKANTTN